MAAAVSVERSSFLAAASWPCPGGRDSPLARGQARLARRPRTDGSPPDGGAESKSSTGCRRELDPRSSCAPVARGFKRTTTESRSKGYHTATGGGLFIYNSTQTKIRAHAQQIHTTKSYQKSYRVRLNGNEKIITTTTTTRSTTKKRNSKKES